MTYRRVAVLGSNSFSGAHFVAHALGAGAEHVLGMSRSAEYDPVFLPYLYRRGRPANFTFKPIDLNEAPERAIRGVASVQEARELAEEGIDVMSVALPEALKQPLQ